MASKDGDQARRENIITHMNRTHQRELSHYLRHYNKLSASAARSPTMANVSWERMLLRTRDGVDHTVPFTPPLTAWDEIRPRVVAMDVAARKSLGISDIQVTAYEPPRGFDHVVFGGVLLYFCCVASLPWVVPGTKLWQTLEVVYPGGPVWFRWLVRTIFWPVVLLHFSEAILFERMRMHRHGVERWSAVWWLWEVDCFIEGIMAWWRVDSIVARKKAEREAKKD